MVLAATGVDMILGILFSAHGGVGWLLLLVAFPWVLFRVGVLCLGGPNEMRAPRRKRALYVLLGYVPISVLTSYFFVARLSPPLNLTMTTTLPYQYFPLSLLVPGW